MDFNLSEERQMLRDTAERFLREQYPLDKRHEAAASPQGFSPEMWSEFGDLGLIGALLPPEADGFGGTGEDIALVFEALGRALTVEPFLASAILAATPLIEAGDTATLAPILAGEKTATLAHYEPEGHEPEGRYSPTHIATRATDQNGWTLTGRKSVVLNPAADTLIVTARTSGATSDEDGLTLFKVDPKAVTLTPYALIDGGAAAELILDAAQATPLGPIGKAFPTIEKTLAHATLAVSAEALGAMEIAKDLTVEYLKTRVQFGQPIGANQVLQHRMVDLLIEIEQARSAIMLAASTLESDRLTRERHVSAAKHLTGRVGRQVAEEVIQMHGGIAMTWEAVVPHYAKRIVMIDHLFGDTDYHLARFIALSKDAE